MTYDREVGGLCVLCFVRLGICFNSSGMYLLIVEIFSSLYFDKVFFLSCPLYFFPYSRISSYRLRLCFFILFHLGGWMICHFSNIQVHFVFCQLNFIVLFTFLTKHYHILFIIIVFWLGCDRPSGLLLFVPALLLSILTPIFLPSSFVSLSYFVFALPMRECLGKHSCMSSPWPTAILNGIFFFSRDEIVCKLGRSFVYQNQIKLNYLISFLLFPCASV